MKIVILGTTGTGKTTLARSISKKYKIPHVELDALNWDPNWVQVDPKLFRERVEKAIASENWVVDGNYSRAGHDLIWPRADLVIWLDYPLYIILWRLLKRVVRRAFTREVLWSGCKESLRLQFLSKNSIFLWAFKSYRRRRRIYPYLLSKYPNLNLIRLRSPKKLQNLRLKNDCWL